MNKKTIIFFLPNFSQGGAAESIVKIMLYMSKLNYKCVLVCLNRCFYKNILKKKNIQVFEINVKKTFIGIIYLRKIIKKIKLENKKVILVSNINYVNVLSIIFLRSIKNLKILLYERTPIQELNFNYGNYLKKVKNIIIKILIKITYKYADKIISNSKTTSSDLSKFIKKKVITIHSQSISKIKPFRNNKNKKLNILWIGRFTKEKSFDTVIKAINILRDIKLKVLVLGNEGNKNEYRSKIKKLKLSDKFIFYGYHKKISKFFKKSSLFINTSLYEGFPNSVIQAINESVPVVTSKSFGGINEIIKNNYSGVFFKSRNFVDLANKIRKFKNNKKLFKKFALNAHKQLKKFKFNNINKKFASEIAKL